MNIKLENQIKIIHLGEVGPNLLTLDLQQELINEFDYNRCKAVIILGNNRIFSAGLNLKDLIGADKNSVSEIFSTFIRLLQTIRAFPGPVISIVSGHSIAGGCLLAIVCDYRYGVFGFHRMGLNEMALSLDLPKSIFTIISKTINPRFLFEVSTQCKLYTPNQAFKVGFINEYYRNPFIGKKFATKKALISAKKLAQFYINAGEPFSRLKETFHSGTDFDHKILIENWFTDRTQRKIQSVVRSL